jgi:hypothetical protein
MSFELQQFALWSCAEQTHTCQMVHKCRMRVGPQDNICLKRAGGGM